MIANKENISDKKITVDKSTLQWLAKVFGCSEPDAVSILVNAAGKKRGAESANK